METVAEMEMAGGTEMEMGTARMAKRRRAAGGDDRSTAGRHGRSRGVVPWNMGVSSPVLQIARGTSKTSLGRSAAVLV